MLKITRRDFIRAGAMGAGAAGVTGLGFDVARAVEVKQTLRIAGAKEVHSLCPYCAVGCSLVAYTRQDEKGHTSSSRSRATRTAPSTRGGSARRAPRPCSSPSRAAGCRSPSTGRRAATAGRRSAGTPCWIGWPSGSRTPATRTFVVKDGNGNVVNRCEGIAFAGGAAFSSEEGYFATKVMRTLGVVHLEQQARV